MQMKQAFEPIKLEQLTPIRETAFEILRHAILSGKLEPGQRLVERELANQLGISRTPIREAIRKLELEGLVTHIPRKGVIVTKVSLNEVIEIFTIRAALEGVAARLASENITPKIASKLKMLVDQMDKAIEEGEQEKFRDLHLKFNDIIYKAANSPRLYQMIQTFVEYIASYTQKGYSHPGRMQEAAREHRTIVEAITSGNSILAEKLAKEHIENSKQAYLKMSQ